MPADFSTLDKFNQDKNFTRVGFGSNTKLLEVELNEMQKINNHLLAELHRMQYHSGVIDYVSAIRTSGNQEQPGEIALYSNWVNVIKVGAGTSCLVNGYKVILGLKNGASSTVQLPAAPTFGTRDDLAFLEAWFEEIDFSEVINKYGGDGAGTITNDLKDSRINAETSRRIQLRWRIRTVAGVDFGKYTEGLKGFDLASLQPNYTVQAQGGATSPMAYTDTWAPSASFYKYGAFLDTSLRAPAAPTTGKPVFTDDQGLYLAGDGTQASKDMLKTVDGYVYAIPLFKVKRRNNGGYRADNQAGARDYYSIVTSAVATAGQTNVVLPVSAIPANAIVGDDLRFDYNGGIFSFGKIVAIDTTNKTITIPYVYNTVGAGGIVYLKSDRPDGLFSNIIDASDITDLRHQVPVNPNYQAILESGFDSLTRGGLTTNFPKTIQRDTYGLVRAPLGLKQELQPTRIQRADGTFVDLVNVLGLAGSLDALSAYGFSNFPGVSMTHTVDTAVKKYGNASIKLDSTTNVGYGADFTGLINTTKSYIVAVDMYISRYVSGVLHLAINDKTAFSGNQVTKLADTTKVGQWQTVYLKTTTRPSSDCRLWFGRYTGGENYTVNVDGLRVYEVDQATYNLIDVDPNYTGGDKIAALYPYVDSLPNLVENLIPPFTDPAWTIHANAVINNANQITLNANANYQITSIELPVVANTAYTLSYGNGNGIYNVKWKSATSVYTPWNGGSAILSGTSATSPSDAAYVRLELSNATNTTGTFTFSNVLLEKQNTAVSQPSPFLPQGRHLIPANYQGNNAHLGNTYNTFHYAGVGGDTFSAQRSIFSDAQTSEARTLLVEALMTPQRHATVTQATAGTWANGSTIKVKSDNGLVIGSVDADTAVARVVQAVSAASVVPLDDVSKFAVNDLVAIWTADMSAIYSSSLQITAIDTINKTVTFGINVSLGVGFLLVEITSATSSPTVTAAGIAGTWTNLGTKEATYTITTPPTDTAATIKIDYTMVYPPGKGMTYVPETIYDGYVNGDRVAAANTVSFKANLAGKVVGNTDANPHSFKVFNGSQTGLQTPTGGFFGEVSAGAYTNVGSLDGIISGHSDALNGAQAQHLFPFDLIRGYEDKYGEIPGCITVADKVAWLKANLSSINCDWYGFGSSVGGNKATFRHWYVTGANWQTWTTDNHSNAGVTKLSNPLVSTFSAPWQPANVIDTNGFVYFLAYADASDGVTASTINTDYVELSVTLATSEAGFTVLQPDNAFPVMGENLLTANQAFPVDLGGLNVFASASTASLSVVNAGEVKAVLTGSSATLMSIYVDKSSTTRFKVKPSQLYTFRVRGKAASSKQIRIDTYWYDANNTLIATTGSTGSYVSATGNWQLLSFSYVAPSNASTCYFELAMQNPVINDELYWSYAAVKEGVVATPWTPGRGNKTAQNFLAKVKGSVTENPHRSLYADASTFGAPSTFTLEAAQVDYDNAAKQDGVLTTLTSTTVGNFAQRLYEFDLSYLGMSLKELKAALRMLSVSWTGYGSGDNAGVLAYGVTMEWWNSSNSWATRAGFSNTGSVPTTGSDAQGTTPYVYLTKDQKVYALVQTTYPASATNPSNLYTDYVKLDVTLADYVDYKKSNIVKVRPETKEIKLMFPAHSYRYLGASGQGQADVIALNTRQVPYQGQSQLDFSQYTVHAIGDIFFTTSSAVGGTKNTGGYTDGAKYANLAEKLIAPTSNEFANRLKLANDLAKFRVTAISANNYAHIAKSPIFGWYASNNVFTKLALGNKVPINIGVVGLDFDYTGGVSGVLVALPLLVSLNGQLSLLVLVRVLTGSNDYAWFSLNSTGNVNAGMLFPLSGRPLVKGV